MSGGLVFAEGGVACGGGGPAGFRVRRRPGWVFVAGVGAGGGEGGGAGGGGAWSLAARERLPV